MAIIICVQGTCLTENSSEHNIIPYQFFSQVASMGQGRHHLLPLYSGPGGFYGVLKGEGVHGYEANKSSIQRDITNVIAEYGPQERLVLYGHSRGGLIFSELAKWMANTYPTVRIDIITSDLAAGPGGFQGPLAVGDNIVSWVNIQSDCTLPFNRQRIQARADLDEEGRVSQWSGNLLLNNAQHNTCIYVNSRLDCERVMAIFVAFWHGFFTPGQPLPMSETNLFQQGVAKVRYFSYGELALEADRCREIVSSAHKSLQNAVGGRPISNALNPVEAYGVSILKKITPARLLERAVADFWPAVVRDTVPRALIASTIQEQLDSVFEKIHVLPSEEHAKGQLQKRVGWMIKFQDMGLLIAQKDHIQQAPEWLENGGLQELVWALFTDVHECSGKVSWSRAFEGAWFPWLRSETHLPALEVGGVPSSTMLQEAGSDIVVVQPSGQSGDPSLSRTKQMPAR